MFECLRIMPSFQSSSRQSKSDNEHCLKRTSKFTFKLILKKKKKVKRKKLWEKKKTKPKTTFAEAFN